jgi:hypothetical protein
MGGIADAKAGKNPVGPPIESSDARTLAKTSRARWWVRAEHDRSRNRAWVRLRPDEAGRRDCSASARSSRRDQRDMSFGFEHQPSIDKAQVREIASGDSSPMARQCCSSAPRVGFMMPISLCH